MRSCRRAKALGYPGRSPPARAIPDYFFKDHKPSAIQGEARLRGLYRIISSKTIISVVSRRSPLVDRNPLRPPLVDRNPFREPRRKRTIDRGSSEEVQQALGYVAQRSPARARPGL